MPFSGFQYFQPAFRDPLQSFIGAAPRVGNSPSIWVNSGYRTNAHQAQLWAKKLAELGGNVALARQRVAPPIGLYGSRGSHHTWGVAADLGYANAAVRQWAHANAPGYGLTFRVPGENWHIELKGGQPNGTGGSSTAVALNDQTQGVRAPQSDQEYLDQVVNSAVRDRPYSAADEVNRPFQVESPPNMAVQPAPIEDFQKLASLLGGKHAQRPEVKAERLLNQIKDYGWV